MAEGLVCRPGMIPAGRSSTVIDDKVPSDLRKRDFQSWPMAVSSENRGHSMGTVNGECRCSESPFRDPDRYELGQVRASIAFPDCVWIGVLSRRRAVVAAEVTIQRRLNPDIPCRVHTSAMRRVMFVGAALAGLAASTAACGSGGPTQSHVSAAVIDHFKGVPKGGLPSTCGPSAQTCVAWADDHSIYVITWGSGSWPMIPTSVDAKGDQEVVIRTVDHDFIQGDNACMTDLAATTSVVRLPDTIDRSKSLTVDVDDISTRLAARPA